LNGKEIEFKVGDRVIELSTNEKGTIARLCSDKDVVYVRCCKDKSQGMVEARTLRKE